MRRLLCPLLIVVALAAWLPSAALAHSSNESPRSSSLLSRAAIDVAGVGLPIVTVPTPYTRVANFPTDGAQAVQAAEHNETMLKLHARQHPLHYLVNVWDDENWFVDFYYQGKRVAEVVETRDARVTAVWTGPLSIAVYARGDYEPQFGHWWVLVPFSLLFLLPFIDLRRRRGMLLLDGLAMLSFLVSYLLFDHAKLVASVWAIYPPMLYLIGRMAWLGFCGPARRVRAAVAPLLSIRALWIGLVVLVAARIALSLISSMVVDVGYSSVIGAHRIMAGQPIYYVSPAHGDTYGPIAYLAYVPFEWLFPWHGTWNYLPSAHAASIVFDLVTIVALVAFGRRLRAGQDGWRLGLTLAWAWSACPFTLLALMMHTNDGLIAMLSVLSLLAFSSPALRGTVLGLAAAAKFAPAALIGLYAGQRDRGLKGALIGAGAFVAVVAISIGLYLPSGGLSEFWNHTLGFQLSRQDVFSIWALHPSLDWLKLAVGGAALILCAVVAFVPRRQRTIAEVSALAAAITIAVQLPAVHWFYFFIVWFVPYVLVAVFAGHDSLGPPHADDDAAAQRIAVTAAAEPELVPVGA